MTASAGAARPGPAGAGAARRWALATAWLAAVAGVLSYTATPLSRGDDPNRAFQQLDMLYLDEPAPAAERLDLLPGVATVVVFCDRCPAPELRVAAELRVVADGELAQAYRLRRPDGTVGPGWVLIDGAGRLRYRTYDPEPAAHRREIELLVGGL